MSKPAGEGVNLTRHFRLTHRAMSQEKGPLTPIKHFEGMERTYRLPT